MKKVLNLSVIFAVLMAAFSFSSCGGSEDEKNAPVITISYNELSGITGQITSDEDLAKVDLQLNGTSVSGFPITKFDAGNMISGKGGSYAVSIPAAGLVDGTYRLIATDKGDRVATSNAIKVGEDIPTTDKWKDAVNTISANGTYEYKQGNKEGVLVVSGLTATSVTVNLDDQGDVVLSDSGNSWLMKDGKSSNQAGAKANASNIVLAKKGGVAVIVDYTGTTAGQNGELTGATSVKFIVKK